MAKKSAEKILYEHMENGDVEEKTAEHSGRVVALCEELKNCFLKKSYKVNWKLLEAAAWLHDIAKEENADEHQRPKIVKKAFKDDNLDVDIDEVVKIIKYHKRKKYKKFNPDKYKVECAILCICDKIDKLNKAWEKKMEKDLDDDDFQDEMLEGVEKCIKYLQKISQGEVLSKNQFNILFDFSMKKIVEFFHTHM